MKIDIPKICATYVILWTFIPFMQVGVHYRLVAVFCLFVWFLSKGVNMFVANSLERTHLIMVMITVLTRVFSMSFYYGLGYAFINSIQMLIMFSIGAISMYYMNRDAVFLRKLIVLSLMVMCIFCVTTIKGVISNPYAARIANSEWLEERFAENENIGLYGYVYMCVLIIPMLFNKLISHKKVSRLFDCVCLVSMIIMIAMVIMSGYMIAIFCSVLGCVIVVISQSRGKPKIIVYGFLAIIFAIYYKNIVGGILDSLMNVTSENPVYYNKFRDFKILFLGGDVSGETVFGRWKNYRGSFQDIIKYPIIGSYFFGKTLGGGHSFVMDTIGKMGWLTALFHFHMIYRCPYKLAKVEGYSNINVAFIIALLIFTILDPLGQEIGIAIYLFFPFFHDLTAFVGENKI